MWTTILIVHAVLAAALVPYFVTQTHLLALYLRRYRRQLSRFREDVTPSPAIAEPLPFVTVQLPVYNERQLVNRLIEAASALDYPFDRFEVQVLDDSTDETTQLIDRKISEVRAKRPELNISHLRRPDRTGYKAGNLMAGLATARGELVAIFDADFIPPPDFLTRTLPGFRDPAVGVVQARLGHLNELDSPLTRSIALATDASYSVEHGGRCGGGLYSFFSGSAGVLRRRALDEAGAWHFDILTEDIDFSLRAQLKGWRILYLEDVSTPAELPASYPAFRIQQFRWMKGTTEVARKMLPTLLFRSGLPWLTRFHTALMLLIPIVFLLALLAGLMSVPMLIAKAAEPQLAFLMQSWMVVFAAIFPLQAYYIWVSRRGKTPMSVWRLMWQLTHLNLLFTGLSLNSAIAAVEGLLGRKSPFVVTPKVGAGPSRRGGIRAIGLVPLLELLLAAYYLGGVFLGIALEDYSLIGMHLLSAIGLAMVALGTIRDSVRSVATAPVGNALPQVNTSQSWA